MSLPPGIVCHQFWPTSFFVCQWNDHPQEAPGIITYLYQLRAQSEDPIASNIARSAKPTQGLFESDFDLLSHNHPGLSKLKRFAYRAIQFAAAHVNGGSVEPDRLRIAFADSWFHITSDGGFHDTHFHGNCSWCGIYYLQPGAAQSRPDPSRVGAPNGGNRFYSPIQAGGAFQDFGNQYLNSCYIDPPIHPGMLLLFPSYLWHSGLLYRGAEDRIVISFNSRVELVQDSGDSSRSISNA